MDNVSLSTRLVCSIWLIPSRPFGTFFSLLLQLVCVCAVFFSASTEPFGYARRLDGCNLIQPQSAKQRTLSLSLFSYFLRLFLHIFGANIHFNLRRSDYSLQRNEEAKREKKKNGMAVARHDRDKMTFWNIYRVETRMAALSNR